MRRACRPGTVISSPAPARRIAAVTGLYALKPWYTRRLAAVVDLAVARGLSPDVFTAAGVAAAAVAAVAIAAGRPVAAALAMAARLAGANLDGAVARARGVSRPWGFVLNEVGDRTADLLGFLGLAVLASRTGTDPATGVALAVAAGLAAGLPTFVSLAAAGAGAGRRSGGPVGKTERCVLFVVAAALPAAMGVVCLLVIVGSIATAGLRLVTAHRELTARSELAALTGGMP
jgi:CDP-diacylglycerol---glycerol-3-phosphate 3-phosphatidyltransferase